MIGFVTGHRMMRVAFWALCCAGIVSGTAARGEETIDGKWIVTLHGSLETKCVAQVARKDAKVAGELVCPEAGMKLPIVGDVAQDGVVGASPAFVWSAARDADTASGAYEGPFGQGTWTAVRHPAP